MNCFTTIQQFVFSAFLLAAYVNAVSAQTLPSANSAAINIAKNINVAVQGEPLDHRVNTASMELGPMPTKDGKRLYFSRQGFPGNTGGTSDEDIWYCEFDEVTQSW